MSDNFGRYIRLDYVFLDTKKAVVENTIQEASRVTVDSAKGASARKLAQQLTEEAYTKLWNALKEKFPKPEDEPHIKIHFQYDYRTQSKALQKECEKVIKAALSALPRESSARSE